MRKMIAIGVIIVLLACAFIASADIKNNEDAKNVAIADDVVEIQVAIFTDEKETDPGFYGPYGNTKFFIYAMKDHDWVVDDVTYRFIPTVINTRDIIKGELTTDNYNMMIYPPDEADENLFFTSLKNLPKYKIRVRQINKFIEQGGGYLGTCGGALIAGGMINKPKTVAERILYRSQLGISGVNFYWNTSIPLLNQFRGLEAESVGAQTYLWYPGWNETTPHTGPSGISLDCPVNKDNPIFDDFIENIRRIRWIGSPAFEVPDNPDREIMVLAKFPNEEFSDNDTTRMHYWKYTGGLRGLIKAFVSGLRGEGEVHWMNTLGDLPMKTYVFAGDWEKTDIVVESDVANKAFLTAEIFPNENGARIVRCAGHPEFTVWQGGHIEETPDNDYNNLYDGFFRWVNITPINDTPENKYNYWIVRRCIAWASQKVPDDDLPPIYGASEVKDIYPFEQSSNFTIIGNSEISDGIESLDLYYRYSTNNSIWSDWILYETDMDGSDGWSWEFNAPNGNGYYEFYSIRHVKYEVETREETVPPGPDAIAHVIDIKEYSNENNN